MADEKKEVITEKESKKSGLAVAALVIGIVGLVLSAVPIINNFAFVLGIIAIIFAIVLLAKKNHSGKVIASLVLGILTIIIVFASQAFYGKVIDDTGKAVNKEIEKAEKELDKVTGDSTEEVLKDDVDVSLGNLNISTDEYGITDSYMEVVVKNKLNKKKSYSIHIEAVDGSGNRIQDDYVYASDLGPNQSQTFKVFEYIEDSKIDAMRTASFNIVEASSY